MTDQQVPGGKKTIDIFCLYPLGIPYLQIQLVVFQPTRTPVSVSQYLRPVIIALFDLAVCALNSCEILRESRQAHHMGYRALFISQQKIESLSDGENLLQIPSIYYYALYTHVTCILCTNLRLAYMSSRGKYNIIILFETKRPFLV